LSPSLRGTKQSSEKQVIWIASQARNDGDVTAMTGDVTAMTGDVTAMTMFVPVIARDEAIQ